MFIQPIFKRPGILFLALFIMLGSVTAWVMDLGCPSALFHCRRTSCEAVPPPPPPAVATAEKPDYGQYMDVMQRQIRRQWQPPRCGTSRWGDVSFKIDRDGSMHDLRVHTPSRIPAYDTAMIRAIENTAPFHSLPPGSPASVDIIFDFDYNVEVTAAACRTGKCNFHPDCAYELRRHAPELTGTSDGLAVK
jgi:TonB family protein